MTTDIHPSFFQIIRKYRHDSSVSDDNFIGALLDALSRSRSNISSCGHNVEASVDGVCVICKTVEDSRNADWADHLNDEHNEMLEFGVE
jgi:hypothetical protein